MVESLNVASILKRAADKGGFTRTRYVEKDFPTSMSDVTVMTFFGDIRSLFVLSSILLKRYREEMKGSRYLILVTWPGFASLFPYVNECWTLADAGILSKFYSGARALRNVSPHLTSYQRNLNHFFEEVVDASILETYYNNGIQQAFWDRFKHVKVTLPSVPSVAILGEKFNREIGKRQGYKVFLFPSLYVQDWEHRQLVVRNSPKQFWLSLAERLNKEGFIPVVYNNFLTHDTRELADTCIFFNDPDFFKVLGAMRAVDCTLDVFSSISRFAAAARAPFMVCDSRARYAAVKEYEIDGLCCSENLPREYIYNFPAVVENGTIPLWEDSLFGNIINKLSRLLPDIDRNTLPLPSEGTHVVPYANVRQQKIKRFGTKFIKVERD